MFSLAGFLYSEINDNNRRSRVRQYLERKGVSEERIKYVNSILYLSGLSESDWKSLMKSKPDCDEAYRERVCKTALIFLSDTEIRHAWINNPTIEDKISQLINDLLIKAKKEEILNEKIDESEILPSNKKCPFCAEEIKYEAIICRYCGRDLPPNTKNKDLEIDFVERSKKEQQKKELQSQLIELDSMINSKNDQIVRINSQIPKVPSWPLILAIIIFLIWLCWLSITPSIPQSTFVLVIGFAVLSVLSIIVYRNNYYHSNCLALVTERDKIQEEVNELNKKQEQICGKIIPK